MEFQWKGVMPALTTKFNEADGLDLSLFEKNLSAQMEAGVDGIILGGTLGEASTLEPEEKELLVKKALERVDGKVPVILNIAEASTASAVAAKPSRQSWIVCGTTLFLVLIVSLSVLPPGAIFLAVAGSAIVALPVRHLFMRKLDGYTGDCLGAVQQAGELGFYLGLAAWV